MRKIDRDRRLAVEAAVAAQLRNVPDYIWDCSSFPVPIETIADSYYGLFVREEANLAREIGRSSGPHISGLLFPAKKEIWVDAEEAHRWPGRKRFTIAHEIGHWVLHCEMKAVGAEAVHCRSEIVDDEEGAAQAGDAPAEPTPRRRRMYPPEERDANQFGAALLMPRLLVESEHAHLDGDERRLAGAFNVSIAAMQWRLWFLEQVIGH
jgi:hypothetical protein